MFPFVFIISHAMCRAQFGCCLRVCVCVLRVSTIDECHRPNLTAAKLFCSWRRVCEAKQNNRKPNMSTEIACTEWPHITWMRWKWINVGTIRISAEFAKTPFRVQDDRTRHVRRTNELYGTLYLKCALFLCFVPCRSIFVRARKQKQQTHCKKYYSLEYLDISSFSSAHSCSSTQRRKKNGVFSQLRWQTDRIDGFFRFTFLVCSMFNPYDLNGATENDARRDEIGHRSYHKFSIIFAHPFWITDKYFNQKMDWPFCSTAVCIRARANTFYLCQNKAFFRCRLSQQHVRWTEIWRSPSFSVVCARGVEHWGSDILSSFTITQINIEWRAIYWRWCFCYLTPSVLYFANRTYASRRHMCLCMLDERNIELGGCIDLFRWLMGKINLIRWKNNTVVYFMSN